MLQFTHGNCSGLHWQAGSREAALGIAHVSPRVLSCLLQVPNGELTVEQLRFLGEAIAPLGAEGCADITTRANIQLRGMGVDGAAEIFKGLQEHGLSSVQTGAAI